MMKKISQLFKLSYGNKFDYGKMNPSDNGIAFVSRTSKNNGLVGYVERYNDIDPYPEGLISVSLGGTYLLSAFVQTNKFYTAQNVAVLEPINEMPLNVKLFYCKCISLNRHKYSAFGREANKTLKDIMVPDIEDIPEEFLKMEIPDFSSLSKPINDDSIEINPSDWKEFKYDDLFIIKGGYYNKKPEKIKLGGIPFISATRENNGITGLFSIDDISLYHKDGSTKFDDFEKKYFEGNCITVVNNGASVGYAFYQKGPFTCSHDINILYLRNYQLNQYIAAFLMTVIEKERYRWSYGRKWRPKRMPDSIIKLPVLKDANGKYIKNEEKKHIPDWGYMENYVKTLSYSQVI